MKKLYFINIMNAILASSMPLIPLLSTEKIHPSSQKEVIRDISSTTGSYQYPYGYINDFGKVNDAIATFDTTPYGGFNNFVLQYPSFKFANTSLIVGLDRQEPKMSLNGSYNTEKFNKEFGLYSIAKNEVTSASGDFINLTAQGKVNNNIIFFVIVYSLALRLVSSDPVPYYKSEAFQLIFYS